MSEDSKTKTASEQESNDPQKRGSWFPTLTLQKAISLMQKVWEKEKRNPAPAAAIVEHWGWAAKSSGGFQALAALKRFGLLEEVGGATPRSLKISQAALDLLRYEGTDPVAYHKQVKFLALLPDLHKEIWDKYGHELPSDKTLETHLVFDKHFSEDAAKQFIRLYKETISFAKLTESDTVEEIKSPVGEGGAGKSEKQVKTDPADNFKRKDVDSTITSGELQISIAGKMVPIPFPMSEDEFELFIGTLNLWKKKLVRKLTAIPPTIPLPKDAMWKNGDSNKPVKLVALMGEQNGERYFQSEDGTGIPESQLVF